MPENDEDFGQYRRLILSEMKRHEGWLNKIDEKLQALHNDFTKEVTRINTQATSRGLIAGAIPGLITAIAIWLMR